MACFLIKNVYNENKKCLQTPEAEAVRLKITMYFIFAAPHTCNVYRVWMCCSLNIDQETHEE